MGKKSKAEPAAKASAHGARGFVFPPADRTLSVAAPPALPPMAEDDGEEVFDDGMPRKLQISHLSLLAHPVFISALENFFEEDECRAWIEWGEKHGFEEFYQRQTPEMAFRDNGRIEFNDPDVANLLFIRLRPFLPDVLGSGSSARRLAGCSPRVRVYRYRRGQRFGQHVDGSRDEPTLAGRTHYTVLVYLNGGERDAPESRVRGGETVFWKDHRGNPTTQALAFPPTRGVCLFHGHGDECMIHEGAAVEEGAKYILRTDAVYET